MKQFAVRHSITAFAAIVLLAAIVPVSVYAIAESSTGTTQKTTATAEATEKERLLKEQKLAAQREAASQKLDATRLKVCQNREKTITEHMTRLAERGNKQYQLITNISDRVRAYYTRKAKTIATYDALVAVVNAKKAAAGVALANVKAASVTFTCSDADPKGVATAFKESLDAQHAALKDYKTAVKNLLTAVKTAQGTTLQDNGGDQ